MIRLIKLSWIFLFPLFFLFSFCEGVQTKVLVSVAPQKYLVEKIGADRVSVEVLVPPGTSPHSYEPTIRQTMVCYEGQLWFLTGEGFEKRLQDLLSSHLKIIDLREGIDLLPLGCCPSKSKECYDSHIWLSPKLLKKQAETIAHALIENEPEESAFYHERLLLLLEELDQLDRDLEAIFSQAPSHTILVSHAAFGYLCRDYQLTQLSIEIEGKEPTSKQIAALIVKAKEAQINRVFVQPQYSQKGALRIAKQLSAELISIDPYEENVVNNLRRISSFFCGSKA